MGIESINSNNQPEGNSGSGGTSSTPSGGGSTALRSQVQSTVKDILDGPDSVRNRTLSRIKTILK